MDEIRVGDQLTFSQRRSWWRRLLRFPDRLVGPFVVKACTVGPLDYCPAWPEAMDMGRALISEAVRLGQLDCSGMTRDEALERFAQRLAIVALEHLPAPTPEHAMLLRELMAR